MYRKSYSEQLGDSVPAETKLKALERLVKAILRVEDIRYGAYPFQKDNVNEITLVDVEPETVGIRGYDEGIEVYFDSEIYFDERGKRWAEEEYGDDVEIDITKHDFNRSRLIACFSIRDDPWELIKELEAKLAEKNAN